MQSNDYALIITGCISPKNTVFSLGLKDASERLSQYIESINYYIKKTTIQNIVFCENSDYQYNYQSLINEAKNRGKNIEVIKYLGNSDAVLEHGKGYGEGEILEYALSHSKLLKKYKYIYKVTGRIIVKNIDEIIEKETINDIYLNKNLYSYKTIDTRFWGMPKGLYEDLFLEQYHKVNDQKLRFIEHVFYETITNTVLKYKQHPFFPLLEGKSGTKNIAYKENRPIYTKWFTFTASKGLFNSSCIYFFSYVFLHWEKCWKEFLGWLKSQLYHYYAEAVVRIKKGLIIARTIIYHYCAEAAVRIKKGLIIARTIIYHYYAEAIVRIKKRLIIARTVIYHNYAEIKEKIKNFLKRKKKK